MKIGGFTPFTLSDYPGQVASIVFTQGCNFKCPFCHNGSLLCRKNPATNELTRESILDFLESRKGDLDGVVLTGGEPTIHSDLPRFIKRIKSKGFLVKLDTNGSNPEMMRTLLDKRLVDYVAMDIKAPPGKYRTLAGTDVDMQRIMMSVILIATSGIAHHFRTTFVQPLLNEEDLRRIKCMAPVGSTHVIQKFVSSNALSVELRQAVPDSALSGSDLFKIRRVVDTPNGIQVGKNP